MSFISVGNEAAPFLAPGHFPQQFSKPFLSCHPGQTENEHDLPVVRRCRGHQAGARCLAVDGHQLIKTAWNHQASGPVELQVGLPPKSVTGGIVGRKCSFWYGSSDRCLCLMVLVVDATWAPPKSADEADSGAPRRQPSAFLSAAIIPPAIHLRIASQAW